MIRLFLVFIVIYVAFTAVSLNYAKAFRVKNKVIDFIEQNEIIELGDSNFNSKLDQLEAILRNASYNKICEKGNGKMTSAEGKTTGYCYNGIVILKESEQQISGTNSSVIKYTVTTFADWNLGTLNKILALGGQSEDSDAHVVGTWAISGEAKVISKK